MKIIIDIPEEEYKKRNLGLFFGCYSTKLDEVICKGMPLPRGHRIGDLDELICAMKERNDDNGGEPLNAFDRGYDLAYQHLVSEAENFVIIGANEAD